MQGPHQRPGCGAVLHPQKNRENRAVDRIDADFTSMQVRRPKFPFRRQQRMQRRYASAQGGWPLRFTKPAGSLDLNVLGRLFVCTGELPWWYAHVCVYAKFIQTTDRAQLSRCPAGSKALCCLQNEFWAPRGMRLRCVIPATESYRCIDFR